MTERAARLDDMAPPDGRRTGFLAAEHEVLLSLGGDHPSDDRLNELLRGGVDWSALLMLAERERAGAELYRRIRRLPGVAVPAPALAALQRIAMVLDFEMLLLEECLRETLALVESHGTPVMLLKGAAIVHMVHGGKFSRRPMADLDLLVDASRALSVQRMLIGGRWKRAALAVADDVYDEHHHLPPLRDARGSGVHLEVHTALFARGHPFGLTPELFWAQAEPLPSRAGPVPEAPSRCAYVPSLAHQLVHVCTHFAWSHAMKFGAWRAFRDVGAVVATGRIDWDAFVRLARETRAVTSCYWTFRLAGVAAGVAVPSEVQRALRPPRPASYLRRLERHYLLNLFPVAPRCPSARLDRALWGMGLLPRWSGHGRARPWDRDSQFIAARDRPSRVRLASGGRIWRAARYLGTVFGTW